MVAMADLQPALRPALGVTSVLTARGDSFGAPRSFQLVKTRASHSVPCRESWHRRGTNLVRIGSGGNPPPSPYQRVGPRRRGRLKATPPGHFATFVHLTLPT